MFKPEHKCLKFWTIFGTKRCVWLSLLRSCKNYFKIYDILGVICILYKKLAIFVLFTLLQCTGGSHTGRLYRYIPTRWICIIGYQINQNQRQKFFANSWRLFFDWGPALLTGQCLLQIYIITVLVSTTVAQLYSPYYLPPILLCPFTFFWH